MKLDAAVVTLLIAVHHVIAYIHGSTHTDLAIVMSVFQNAFIYFVILLVPLAGAVLTWMSRPRIGLWAVIKELHPFNLIQHSPASGLLRRLGPS